MSLNLRKCMEKLKTLASIKDDKVRAKALADVSDSCLYKALHEIAVNTVGKKITLSPKVKKSLRKYNLKIKKLSCKTKDTKKQKKLVVQSGGFLPILIPAVTSIITSLIASKK